MYTREKTMQIEVDIEDFEKIMAEQLTVAIENFERDLQLIKRNEPNYLGMFSIDLEEDRRQIKKMIKAMKRVRTWYGVGYEL